MSDERKLTEEDREKIQRLLESGTLENVNLALSLIEETAGQKDIADIFTMNVIVELICLGDSLFQATSIMMKCPITWKVFVEVLADPFIMTSRDYRSRNIDFCEFATFSSAALSDVLNEEYHIDLSGLTVLSTVTAEILSKHDGALYLRGLTELSDATAESLSEHAGELSLSGLTELSNAAAKSLCKHEGELSLSGLTELSNAAAKSLCKHEGDLYLNGLSELTDGAAESLSKHEDSLYLNGLNELSNTAALQLASHTSLETNAKIKRKIKKAVSKRKQQARKAASTGKTALTNQQKTKMRKLLRSKSAENVEVAVELIDISEATKDDISDVLSASVLSLLINTWDVGIWNSLAPLLNSYPNAKREFTELAEIRLQQQFESSYKQKNEADAFLNRFYKDLTRPLALLELKFLDIISGDLYLDLTELSEVTAQSLSGFDGDLFLSSITSLSDGPGHIALAESLSKNEGYLNLAGLTSLSDAAAESLSKHKGTIDLDGLSELSDAVAERLSKT